MYENLSAKRFLPPSNSPCANLIPERKKNMGMFQAFMLMMNQRLARCQPGTCSGMTRT